jgi:(E)-4-hydroxy-3-methylbut-2-enyl-diphosphate synthase
VLIDGQRFDRPAFETLRAELASLGLVFPISVRVGADPHTLEAFAGLEGVGRIVVEVGPGHPAVPALADSAASADCVVEWSLEAEVDEIPELLTQILMAARPSPPSAFSLAPGASLHAHRVLAAALKDHQRERTPIVLRHSIAKGVASGLDGAGVPESALLEASIRLGGLLCDGIGDAVSIHSGVGAAPAVDLAYRILQGARQRTTRTEYISCPSCGRTLFDLEETTARIKARTDHLSGVKIAVMGCIVNGPGEMADADFGYVGSGVGQVTLYVGKDVVARAVPEAEATDRLVDLIREHDRWTEPA